MKLVKFAIATTALFGFTTAAQAQDSNTYAAVSIDSFEFDSYGLSARLGYNFSENFGVEGQAGFGVIDDKETFGNVEIKTGIDTYFAGFVTGRAPVADKFELIGRLGYYSASATASGGGFSESADVDGFAVGVGGIFALNETGGIRAEYTMLDGEGGNGDLFSIGYQHKF